MAARTSPAPQQQPGASVPTIAIDLGTALVKWARTGDVRLRDTLRTNAAAAEQLRTGRDRTVIAQHVVPLLQMVLHGENIATLPLGANPPTIALLTGAHTNPDVVAVVRDFFENAGRVRCTVLSSAAAALAAGGLTSGVVVDIGRHSTRCHAVVSGYAVPRASRVTPRGFDTVMDALRRRMLEDPVIKEKHVKRVQGDAVIESTLIASGIVAPPEPANCAQPGDSDAVSRQRTEALEAQVPVMLRFDIVPVCVAPAFEALFAPSDGETVHGLPIGSLVAETLNETCRLTQLAEATSAICVVGTCADVPGLRRRVLEESVAYARSEEFDAPDRARIAEALLDAVAVNPAPYTAWAAPAVGGALLVDAGL